MKITEIDWTEGKRYEDDLGGIWEVYASDLRGVNTNQKNVYISNKYSLQVIAQREFEEVKEQKYYLQLNKAYVSEKNSYLNVEEGASFLSNNEEVSGVKVKFTKAEIKDLVDEFGVDIMDFDRIPVED